jgi:hypothetical protein
MMEKGLKLFIKNFFRRETILRAIKVALFVGPILIIINHHDSLLQLDFSNRQYFKFMLTFLVPFCVSAYSSAQAYSAQELRISESAE